MYCEHCGKELADEAVVCPNCGCATGNYNKTNNTGIMHTIIKVFMILGCVAAGFYLIPLCWMIPMTVTYCNRSKQGIPMGTGFKVCTLLFVNLIAGILMLCENAESE